MFNNINICGKVIPGYSLSIIIGLILGNVIGFYIIKRKRYNSDHFMLCEAYILLGALIGAKLFYLWISRDLIDWSRFFEIDYFNSLMRGGFVFYGGLIGGFSTFFIACRIHHIKEKYEYMRILSFLIPFVHAFGRIGCFCAGCCYGKPYNGPFAVVFPDGSIAPSGISLFPIQLLEAFLLFILSFIVFLIWKKTNNMTCIFSYFIGYGVIRFVLEFYRYDYFRGKWLCFSTSQWISLIIVIISVLLIIKKSIKKAAV